MKITLVDWTKYDNTSVYQDIDHNTHILWSDSPDIFLFEKRVAQSLKCTFLVLFVYQERNVMV